MENHIESEEKTSYSAKTRWFFHGLKLPISFYVIVCETRSREQGY